MKQCSISIIVPAYNVEDYIGDALQSIINQTTAPDELILIDDGSVDRTLDIIHSFEFNFPVKIISIENGGQGNARNLGVSMASSDYIYFFDSDDLLENTFVDSMKELISEYDKPDIILFSGESFDDEKYEGDRWVSYRRKFSGNYRNRTRFLDKGYKNKGLFCSPCLYVSKKSIWVKENLKFEADYLEDEAIFFPLLFSCVSFSVLDEIFFYRRNREGSTMTVSPNSKHVRGALNCIVSMLSLYRAGDLTKRDRWHIKRRIERHCATYCRMAREAGMRLSYKRMAEAMVVTKSAKIALISMLYVTYANESRLVLNARSFFINVMRSK